MSPSAMRVLDRLPQGFEPAGAAWLPPEAPLAMPRQALDRADDRPQALAAEPRDIKDRRALLLSGTVILAGLACAAPLYLYARRGMDQLELFAFAVFGLLILAIACWFCNGVAGLLVLLSGREQSDIDFAPHPPAPRARTALLAPIYNEDVAAVFERLSAIDASLARLGAGDAFDLFVLSDSRKPGAIAAERTAFQALRLHAASAVYYRRRERNTEHKSGNIAEWTQRFGGAYDYMVVLDADSFMAGETLLRLVDAMERHPGVGLIQTTPVIVGAKTLFARVSQFSVRLYGRVAAAGLAWWTGAEGSYWGHNAILRVRAFADCAGLPILAGEKPFGGPVLSHDVVEAALLRRAGWAVHVTAALDGSCEETPPTITDFIRRDHRWCQGNLQHLSLLNKPGLSVTSRLQLAMGCMSYLASPLWLASLAAGLAIQLQQPPDWGAWWYMLNPEVTAFTLASLLCAALLVGPKVMGAILVLSRPGERRAFGGTSAVLLGMTAEIALSALFAPILMIANTVAVLKILRGDDIGWSVQQRDADGVTWREAFRAMTWQMVAGLGFAVAICFRLDLVFLFLPIILPLLAAPAIAVWTSRRRSGEAFVSRNLLVTPDDDRTSAMPAVISVRPAADAAALAV